MAGKLLRTQLAFAFFKLFVAGRERANRTPRIADGFPHMILFEQGLATYVVFTGSGRWTVRPAVADPGRHVRRP